MQVPTQGGLVLLVFIRTFLFVEHRAVRVAVLPAHVPSAPVFVLLVFLLLLAVPRDHANADVSNQAPAAPRLQLRLGDLSVILLLFLVVFFLVLLIRVVVLGPDGTFNPVRSEDGNKA